VEPFGSETGERWIEACDGEGKPDAINRGETGSAESEGDEPLRAILGHPALVPEAAATCEGGGRDHKGEHRQLRAG
jgi:hypothetical protein